MSYLYFVYDFIINNNNNTQGCDKVNHFGLFIKLINRTVPKHFLLVLINWNNQCYK